jgi:cytochrome c oxidase subunit 1
MPSGSILPFIMSVGLFIAAFGLMYEKVSVAIIGALITLLCMLLRSLIDDPGYHVDPTEDKGVEA